MSTPLFFNPAKISLAAKAWECLRRNDLFKEIVRSYFLTPESERWPQTQLFENAEKNSNRIAEAGFCFIAYHATEDAPLPTWEALPWNVKEKIEWSVDLEMGEAIPEIIDLESISVCKGNSGLELHRNLRSAIRTGSTLLIALPARIRDKKHRAIVEKHILSFIPEPIADSRSFEGKGRLLGTEMQWDAFLRYELWKELGYSRGTAAILVAAERRGKVDFGKERSDRTANAKRYLGNGEKRLKSAYDFECDFEVIEHAIDGVFPSFSAYSRPA